MWVVIRRFGAIFSRPAGFPSIFMSTMSSSESSSKPAVVAVCQMTATDDVGVNLSICQKLINKSKKLGASMTFLPGAT